MKKIIFLASIVFAVILSSCDKVDNPYPPTISYDLDTTIYPGNWSTYQSTLWPDFSTIPNADPNRNALLEDYTGHNCSFCPAAATEVHNIVSGNASRVFAASVHASSSSDGMSSFQAINVAQGYVVDFTNIDGLGYGSYFYNLPNSGGFFGNPAVSVNRIPEAGEYFSAQSTWQTKTDAVLASPLKVEIKAKVNYFESPKHGLFLHTEISKDPAISNPCAVVVCLIEDTLVAPQNVSNTFTPNYVHRDIFRGTIDGNPWGRTLTDDLLENQKYYLDYDFIVPPQLSVSGTGTVNAENMHLLIYVYDKTTLEIYQVIKKKIVE